MVQIGLVGQKGSGKTTLAQSTDLRIETLAKPIKDGVEDLFISTYDLSPNTFDKEKVRPFYQLVGNWARENIDPNYWCHKLNLNGDFIIDDIRHQNEIDFLKRNCNDLILIYLEPLVVFDKDDQHISESGVPDLKKQCDYIINGEDRCEKLQQILHNL